MFEDDEEPADLLADEDRVRDALLAAVDGQLVPPVRTDFTDILQRGRRRARLQVVGASVAAVVLIAAVALGATVLGRLGGTDRVSTAAGPSLPVSSQTITTIPNPPSSAVPQSDYVDAACVFPTMVDAVKWLPLDPKQSAVFLNAVGQFEAISSAKVDPAVADDLPDELQASAESVEVFAKGPVSLVTLSESVYSGSATLAAELDARQTGMPQTCVGSTYRHTAGKTMMVVNEYSPLGTYTDVPTYLRVQAYSNGVRYDLTEAVNAERVIDYPTATTVPATLPPTANTGRGSAPGFSWPPALTTSQLVDIVAQVASRP